MGNEDLSVFNSNSVKKADGSGSVQQRRDNLIAEYRKRKRGIIDSVRAGEVENSDGLISLIVDDLLSESENLMGNSLYFMDEGELHDSTAVTIKRADLLKTIADILVKKRELNQKDADVDLNSPAFQIFQKICFNKMTTVLEELSFDSEMKQLILSKWSIAMRDWGKELQNELKEIR